MIMILARVFVPTVATFLPQPRVLSSLNTALTTLSQKSSSALIQVSSVLTLLSKRMMWKLDIFFKKFFFSNAIRILSDIDH